MDAQLENLLSKVVEKHVTQVFHLFLDVRLPLEALVRRLRQDVQLDEVFIAGKETKSLKQAGPSYQANSKTVKITVQILALLLVFLQGLNCI